MYTEEEREKVRKRLYTERMVDFNEPLSEADQNHLNSIKAEI